jgi:hypothetical protein
MIAGHIVDGNPRQTQKLRDRILHEHVKAVRQMIPLQSQMLEQRMIETGRPN